MVYPPLLLYICYSLHPAIRILLTLACLIRVRQRKIKTKASPFFFFSLPTTCLLPPSNASSFLSPPSHSSQLDHREIVLIDLLKPTRILMAIQRLFCDNRNNPKFYFSHDRKCQWCSISSLFVPTYTCHVCVRSSWDCDLIVSWIYLLIIYLFGVARLVATFPFTTLWFAYTYQDTPYMLSTVNQSK